MDICERCGNVKESTIPQTEHEYETQVLPATCTSPGYTLNECVVCGDRHITDLTPALSHDYAASADAIGERIRQLHQRALTAPDPEALADELWTALNEDNKVSLFVRYINLADGTHRDAIRNKHQ